MKTVEEMREAVLAECETVCPKIDQVYFVEDVAATLQRCQFETRPEAVWELLVGGRTSIIWANMDGIEIVRIYRLLGLSERDAVEDTKAFYESLFTELKQSDLQLVEIYAQAEVGRSQAEKRNAALVAAAELVIKRNWERINGDGSDYSLFSQAIGNLGDALAANENGGAND